ncbi:hypothetical protein HDV05_000321 [Chytridiales sp. JEL 0842]|nr:hypothetical protein HDV05_000321 [Chytridiales sp. JEL 0842]
MSREAMFDSRLFNQSAGIGSGFGSDDTYNVYDKPLFAGSSSAAIYKPKKADHDEEISSIPGVRTDRIEKIVDGSSRAPHKGFQGAEASNAGPRDGPVQFEKEMDEADPFGLEQFMSTAKRGREKEDASKDRGSMMASGAGKREDYDSRGSGRRMQFESSRGDDRDQKRQRR